MITYIRFHLRHQMAVHRLYGVVSYAVEAIYMKGVTYLRGEVPRRLQWQHHSAYYRRLGE